MGSYYDLFKQEGLPDIVFTTPFVDAFGSGTCHIKLSCKKLSFFVNTELSSYVFTVDKNVSTVKYNIIAIHCSI